MFQRAKKNVEAVDDLIVHSDSDAEESVIDLEDLGSFVRIDREKEVIIVQDDDTEEEDDEDMTVTDGPAREMLTPLLREELTKQGYRLIGTHSGVKLCRWTKVRSGFLFH